MTGFEFLHPALLLGLLALPALWWVLRTVPPPPQHRLLATLRFLIDLPQHITTPRAMPWWWLLLRLGAIAALVLALAAPVLMPRQSILTGHVARLVLDNSWPAQASWGDQIHTARSLIEQARSRHLSILLATTAPRAGQDAPEQTPLLTPDQALHALPDLAPQPWPANHSGLKAAILAPAAPNGTGIVTFWLGHGVDEANLSSVLDLLLTQGPVHYYAPATGLGPVQLSRDPDGEEGKISLILRLLRPQVSETVLPLTTFDEDGKIIRTQAVTIPPGKIEHRVALPIEDFGPRPPRVLRIEQAGGAAATLVLDGIMARRQVTLLTPAQSADVTPLADPLHYLTRALEPYANLTTSPLASAFHSNPDVIVAPDLPVLEGLPLDSLLGWINKGGVLLRFAGPQTAAGSNPELTPTLLHRGERSFNGLSNWQTSPDLDPFPPMSPLADLHRPDPIALRTQVLSEPGTDLAPLLWARLSDGTPFITAKHIGKGLIVLVHTRADPSGSDLPLTGFYVSFLKKVLQISGRHTVQTEATPASGQAQATPWQEIDAAGELRPARQTTQSLPVSSQPAAALIPDARHPPGLYLRGVVPLALNLGEALPPLSPVHLRGLDVTQHDYAQEQGTHNLQPILMLLAFVLFLIDLTLLVVLQRIGRIWRAAPLLIVLCSGALFVTPFQARADNLDAGLVHFGYVSSGNTAQDQIIRAGLSNLMAMLKQRTAISVGDVVQVSPLRDDLSLFPVIYWPVTNPTQTLAKGASVENVQTYLRHGGVILFDTADRSTTSPPIPTANYRALQSILTRLETGPIRPAPSDHVLRRCFYLLRSPDESGFSGPDILVQSQTGEATDGVSSVIVTSEDWARTVSPPLAADLWTGATPEQEHAIRFGINVMMYALTGNYKSDQVHLPFILERLRTNSDEGVPEDE